MLTAKEYYLWSHFMCDYYYDKNADYSCGKCPFEEEGKGCVADDFPVNVDIDFLIDEVEKFKTWYMKEKYENITYFSLFKEKFPKATAEIFNICPKIIFGEDSATCPGTQKDCSTATTKFCWSKFYSSTIMPPEVENIMEKY